MHFFPKEIYPLSNLYKENVLTDPCIYAGGIVCERYYAILCGKACINYCIGHSVDAGRDANVWVY